MLVSFECGVGTKGGTVERIAITDEVLGYRRECLGIPWGQGQRGYAFLQRDGAPVMKKIEAVVQPFTVDEVKDALMALGVGGVTVTEVRRAGHESDRSRDHSDAAETTDFVPKAAVEVVVADRDVASVVSAICQVAQTGLAGDGTVFVLPVSAAIRIRTGETGEAVLW